MKPPTLKPVIAAACVLLLCAGLVWAGLPAWATVGTLLFGWGNYLVRVGQRIQVDWGQIIAGLVCMAVLTVGLHAFLRWLWEATRPDQTESGSSGAQWKFRWTGSLVAVVILMFATGIACVGIAHQTAWLATSPQDFTAKRLILHGDVESNLREIGLAMFNYQQQNVLPRPLRDPQGRALHSWQTQIGWAMFVDTEPVDMSLPWNHPRNAEFFKGLIPSYLNPAIGEVRNAENYGLSHFAGNVYVLGDDPPFRPGQAVASSSAIVLAGEAASQFKPWGDPTNLRDLEQGLNRSPDGFGSPSQDGAHLLMLDGSVKFFRNDTDPAILRRIGRPEQRPADAPMTQSRP